jgi:hypothetical protein
MSGYPTSQASGITPEYFVGIRYVLVEKPAPHPSGVIVSEYPEGRDTNSKYSNTNAVSPIADDLAPVPHSKNDHKRDGDTQRNQN